MWTVGLKVGINTDNEHLSSDYCQLPIQNYLNEVLSIIRQLFMTKN